MTDINDETKYTTFTVKPELYIFDPYQTHDLLVVNNVHPNIVTYFSYAVGLNHFIALSTSRLAVTQVNLLERFSVEDFYFADNWISEMLPLLKLLSQSGYEDLMTVQLSSTNLREYVTPNELVWKDTIEVTVPAKGKVIFTWFELNEIGANVAYTGTANIYTKRYKVIENNSKDKPLTVEFLVGNILINSLIINGTCTTNITGQSAIYYLYDNIRIMVAYFRLELEDFGKVITSWTLNREVFMKPNSYISVYDDYIIDLSACFNYRNVTYSGIVVENIIGSWYWVSVVYANHDYWEHGKAIKEDEGKPVIVLRETYSYSRNSDGTLDTTINVLGDDAILLEVWGINVKPIEDYVTYFYRDMIARDPTLLDPDSLVSNTPRIDFSFSNLAWFPTDTSLFYISRGTPQSGQSYYYYNRPNVYNWLTIVGEHSMTTDGENWGSYSAWERTVPYTVGTLLSGIGRTEYLARLEAGYSEGAEIPISRVLSFIARDYPIKVKRSNEDAKRVIDLKYAEFNTDEVVESLIFSNAVSVITAKPNTHYILSKGKDTVTGNIVVNSSSGTFYVGSGYNEAIGVTLNSTIFLNFSESSYGTYKVTWNANSINYTLLNYAMPDSIRIKEIHASLQAGKFSIDENTTTTLRVANLGYYVERIARVLGISVEPDGSIRSVRQRRVVDTDIDTVPAGWGLGQWEANKGEDKEGQVGGLDTEDRDGMVYTNRCNRSIKSAFNDEDFELGSPTSVLCENYPQIIVSFLEDLDQGLNWQEMGAMAIPSPYPDEDGNTNFCTFEGMGTLLAEVAFNQGLMSKPIQQTFISSIVTQSSVKALLQFTGAPLKDGFYKVMSGNNTVEGNYETLIPIPMLADDSPTAISLGYNIMANQATQLGSQIKLNKK